MKWIQKSNEESRVNSLSTELEVNETLIKVLLNRGLTDEEVRIVTTDIAQAIIDPSELKDAQQAAVNIKTYLDDEDALIIIRADYDVDGITSGYILGSALRDVAQCRVEVSYPERTEGYGLRKEFCDLVIDYKFKNNINRVLVITVDNGITAVDEVDMLKEANIEVIITDHHQPKEVLPNCLIVDPHKDEEDTFNHLAGCGVAFKVAQLVQRLYGTSTMNNYLSALAIGTIADMMPMTLENIAFAMYGLDQMNSEECPLGLQALKEYLGKEEYTYSDIGWEIGPRLNSCGRMGNITLATQLFFTENKSYDEIMDDIVVEIDKLNIERKAITETKTKEAIEKADESANVMVITLDGCPEGVAGVVANKVLEHFNKPVIVLAETEHGYVGSARCIEGLNIQEILKEQQEKGLLQNFGGHEAAAGLSINKKQLKPLRESLAKTELKIEVVDKAELPLVIDDKLCLCDCNMNLLAILNSVPYDKNTFQAPVFELEVEVDHEKTTTTKSNPDNLWLAIKDKTGSKKIWCRGLTKTFASLGPVHTVRIAAQLKTDFMNQHRTATLDIIDIKEA